MEYTVGQFAKLFKTTEHTLRYYTDIGLLPCRRDGSGKRVFDDESANWMQGIVCLKGCGASLEDIREYCALCRQPETGDNLKKRYEIILRQQRRAYRRLEEAKSNVEYMDAKVRHYEDILSGLVPDDTNPGNWSRELRPEPHR